MNKTNHSKFRIPALIGLVLALTLIVTFVFATSTSLANNVSGRPDEPQLDSGAVPSLLMAQDSGISSLASQQSLSNQLSYYFVSGNTFTPAGNVSYSRQVTGCVNQMPLGIAFSAPVHLPQGSKVVSITAYTWNNVSDATTSTAYFIMNDGIGSGGYSVSAISAANTIGYQQVTSTDDNPTIVDNQNYGYLVEWRKNLDTADSLNLSLCGVRVAYYAPLGAIYLPVISR